MTIIVRTLPIPGGVHARVVQLFGPFVSDGDHEDFVCSVKDVTRDVNRVIVDCAELTLINSIFVGKLVTLHAHCMNRNTPLIFCGVSRRFMHMLHTLGLDEVFEIVEDEAVALTWQSREQRTGECDA
ncbi:MAG: STAS domain-containing protein [Patescibacteria group bacterium]|jgi:anti-anti-sigma regulatory factor